MNARLKLRSEEISQKIRQEHARLSSEAPETIKEELKKLLFSLLENESTEEALAILDRVYPIFPSAGHERDKKIKQNQAQLMSLQEEIRELRARLDDNLKKDDWSTDIGTELSILVFKLIYGEETNLSYALRNRSDDFAIRLNESLKILLTFINDFFKNYSNVLGTMGVWSEEGNDVLQIIKDRLTKKMDPGPDPLKEYLEKFEKKLPILLAAHHRAAVDGARNILKDLSPDQIKKHAASTRVKNMWETYREVHSRISSYKESQFYRHYFDEIFRKTFKEEES